MTAYYNEIDPKAAQWLRNLIAAGHIAPGVVDERSIEDVTPDDLRGYTQCHFFAGVGVWSLALRRAGWRDDTPVWTASCPCQPFSAAGKSGGFADPRHLWPALHWLVSEYRPSVLFGEQVASKAVEPWIDLVQADVEALDYAFGCIAFPSSGVGAPHIRDRAYWVGDTDRPGSQGHAGHDRSARGERPRGSVTPASVSGGLAHASDLRRDQGRKGVAPEERHGSAGNGTNGRLAHNELQQRPEASACGDEAREWQQKTAAAAGLYGASEGLPCPTNGFWRDADWIFCRDGKWRPVEPGTQPLVEGAPSRVVRLRAYGNAINAEAAQAFIESWIEAKDELRSRPTDLDELI